MSEHLVPSKDDILKAAEHLRHTVIKTPLIQCKEITKQLGAIEVVEE